MGVTRTIAIANFLKQMTHPDLAEKYNHDMECQVNVAQDNGERVDGEFKGKKWQAWTDGIQIWKSFRIPYNAGTKPEYEDVDMKYDLAEHADGIGMTGWDWKSQVSRWVGFDFDAITGHSDNHTKKLSDAELRAVQDTVMDVPWVTTRYSTGGKGLHLYVKLNGVPTETHHEHAALARAILGKLAALTGFDFQSRVDVCGGNLWIWHRKMKGTNGLSLIKDGITLDEIPDNWMEHLNVVTGRRRKVVPGFIAESDATDVERLFEELSGQRSHTNLDDEHKALIKWMEDQNVMWSWDQDSRILTCHTADLKRAHTELGFRGVFETIAKGTESGSDWNSFAYPMRRGGWSLRRFTPGVAESPTWQQDGSGWTQCYYNTDPDLRLASSANSGVEDADKGGYRFREAEVANKAANQLGVDLNLPSWANSREVWLREHKDGRLVAELERKENDNGGEMNGWQADKKVWKRVFSAKAAAPQEIELGNYDDMVRHLVAESGVELGWTLKCDGQWQEKAKDNIRTYLVGALDLSGAESNKVMGSCLAKPWTIVNRPFQPELVGDRKWNRHSAQLRYLPTVNKDNLSYPTWMSILNHLGTGLDAAVTSHPWCKASGILTGADYLKCWIASLFQEPEQPLPYLFFYSNEQSTGKSMFHEALGLLVTKGVEKGDNALINQQGFNGELEGSILCVVEETDLRRNKQAYNRIKDMVTSPILQIHPKGGTPYNSPNTTHWVQCVSDDNWIATDSGLRRVKDLIELPFRALVDGKCYQTSGFYKTGELQTFELNTKEGVSLTLTDNHPILVDYDGLELWTEARNLVPGCKIKLHNHQNCSWYGSGTWNEGYLLGLLIGDGTIGGPENNSYARIELFKDDEELVPFVSGLLGPMLNGNWGEDCYCIHDVRINDLRKKFEIKKNKKITDEIMKASSLFLRGFISAFFDTDGSANATRCEVSLKQSNFERLQCVQQCLFLFGINSYISKVTTDDVEFICGIACHPKQRYILHVTKDNVEKFKNTIGFKRTDKTFILNKMVNKRKDAHWKKTDDFTLTFQGLVKKEVRDVFDVTVPGPEMFCANGIKVHNCANDINYCPMFQGDTRITMIEVAPFPPGHMRTKKDMIPLLQKEAPDFMAEIMDLEIPASGGDRLNIPVIATEEKIAVEASNRSLLEIFIHEECFHVTGRMIKYSEFYDKFSKWIDPNYLEQWGQIKVGRSLPKAFPKGRYSRDGQFYVGNLSWEPLEPDGKILPEMYLKGDRLEFREIG